MEWLNCVRGSLKKSHESIRNYISEDFQPVAYVYNVLLDGKKLK